MRDKFDNYLIEWHHLTNQLTNEVSKSTKNLN